jgi:hypothetical protein
VSFNGVLVNVFGDTLQPVDSDGDKFFGLSVGTNGTATVMRRQLLERPGQKWRRHNGTYPFEIHHAPRKGDPSRGLDEPEIEL